MTRQPPPPVPWHLRPWQYTTMLEGDPFEIARKAQELCGSKWRYRVSRTFESGEFSCDSESATDEMKKLFPAKA